RRKRAAALGMGDEGRGLTVPGGDVDLLVDHGVSGAVSVCVGFARLFIRIQRNHRVTRQEVARGGRVLSAAASVAILCGRTVAQTVGHRSCFMTQTTTRFFDEIGRLMNDAAGAAQGMKKEVDPLWRAQAEKILRDLDLVKREEFEAVKDMARLAREENEALKARIAAVEGKLGVSPDNVGPTKGGG